MDCQEEELERCSDECDLLARLELGVHSLEEQEEEVALLSGLDEHRIG